MNLFNFSIELGFALPLLTFITALAISYKCYPIIIKVSNLKNLMAEPNQRDVHSTKTPNLGGIGLFIAIYIVIIFLGSYLEFNFLLNLLGAIMAMFFIGLVDDLVGMRPKSKLIGQIVVAFSVILLTNLRIVSLYGLIGIYELPYTVSVGLTVMFFITIINAYNLIDGVDGLAGSFAITANLFFAVFFYFTANYFMCFLSIGVIGALISFLIFNFSNKNKIFMGDTGSMVLGFLLSYQALHILSLDLNENFSIIFSKDFIYIIALFSFPLIDTIRVFFMRIKEGKSPFTADNNHIHHNLLKNGFKHWEISAIASFFTIGVVFLVFLFNKFEINIMTSILALAWLIAATTVKNLNLPFRSFN